MRHSKKMRATVRKSGDGQNAKARKSAGAAVSGSRTPFI